MLGPEDVLGTVSCLHHLSDAVTEGWAVVGKHLRGDLSLWPGAHIQIRTHIRIFVIVMSIIFCNIAARSIKQRNKKIEKV